MLIPLVGRLMGVVPVKYLIAAGGLALGGSLFVSMNLVPDIDFFHLALFRALQSGSLALLFVPISTVAYSSIPKNLDNDATALFSMARNVVGGFGISISTALITEHAQMRQSYLVDNLSNSSQPYVTLMQQLQQALINHGNSMQNAMQSAPGQVFSILQTQAATLSYIDVFFITGWHRIALRAHSSPVERRQAAATPGRRLSHAASTIAPAGCVGPGACGLHGGTQLQPSRSGGSHELARSVGRAGIRPDFGQPRHPIPIRHGGRSSTTPNWTN